MFVTLDTERLKALIGAQSVTHYDLARRSGVSRVQLSRILAAPVEPRVRQGTLERLARALRIAPEDLSVDGRLRHFEQMVAEEHGYIDFRGIGMPNVQRQPIRDVFVDVDLSLQANGEGGDECPPLWGGCSGVKSDPGQPMPATKCIATHDRVVMLGNPGCGKTTVLRFLAHWYATRDDGNAETPIYIRLPEFCRARELDERVDLIRFVAARAAERGCPDVESRLTAELADDRRCCLVLLDGLDEVGGLEQRERLIDCIQALVEKYPRNRYVITSRVVGFEPGPWRRRGFAVFKILKYSARQLKAFAEKWARVLSQTQGKPYEEVLENLATAIFSNPRVRALASNPLILTILVMLNEARGGTLPRRRVDLYEKVVDVFLDTWESNKRSAGKFDDTYSIDLDAREFRWLLSDLSGAMQKADRTVAARWWLADRMQEYLQQRLGFAPDEAKDACDRIIRYLAERTGLIEERGLGLFAFSHRTLQEYFASLGVIDEADASTSRDVTDCLRGYYYHPQWSEVVRLVAAQLTPPLAESLVSRVLDDPDPVGRFLRRGPLLALKCLSDGTTVANRRLVAGVFDSLAELGKSRWLGITLEAIDVLDSFAATRLQEHADGTLASILDTARRELPAGEYECLYGHVHAREILESAQEALPADFSKEAAREVAVTHNGKVRQVICLNSTLLLEDSKAWYSSLCSLLEDPRQSTCLKEVLVGELGRRVATDPRSRIRLRKILSSAEDASLRAACASALAVVTKGRHSMKRPLARILEEDRDSRVRAACAMALRDAAGDDVSVRWRLTEILGSDEQPAAVRAGVARGLTKVAISEPSVLEMLRRFALPGNAPGEVNTACAWALGPKIGKNHDVTDMFQRWLDQPDAPELQRIAARALAVAMADERLTWDERVVERVESVLMSLEDPCPCALESLEKLATAREIHCGLRLETVLRDSLRPLGDSVELAFVFGSTARNRQEEGSDIDLFVMGDVNLKWLSGPLRQAERTLGRRINPVIYTRDSFRQKCHGGDPFLLDVYRQEKIPVIPAKGDPSGRDLHDELRTMVSERLAATD